jgi:ABC-2 type transport system permease protein
MTASFKSGVATPPGRQRGSLPAVADFYWATMRTAAMSQLQYRSASILSVVGWVIEPVIYLVVWSTVADQSGGSVAGLTRDDIVAYYIVWTLVRNMNTTYSPFGWEHRIARGHFSVWLLRPVHPIHYDLAYFAGLKLLQIAYWLPIALGLTFAFHPNLDPSAPQVAVFVVAIWLAYLIRTLFLWALGMLTLWTTRISAVFEIYLALELFLSGRLVPIQLLPQSVHALADYLPFSSTFDFPTRALSGPITNHDLAIGLARQIGFCAIGVCIVRVAWTRAIGRYTAVGN